MSHKSDITLIDLTLREGGFRINHHLLPSQAADHCQELTYSGIRHVELSHGCGIGAKAHGYPGLHSDQELLEAAKKVAPNLKYSAYISTWPYSFEAIEAVAPYFEIGRVGINVDEVEDNAKHIQLLKKLNKKVIVQILRAHLRSVKETAIAAKQLEDLGVDIIYLTDSFGSMDEEEIKKYIFMLKEKIQIPIGFHGKNNTGRAVHNSWVAVESGASYLDAALFGMGDGAGITPMEPLVALLQRQGYLQEINLEQLFNCANWRVTPTFRSYPHIGYLDLLFSKHKIDLYPRQLLESLAIMLELEMEDLLIRLKKRFPQMTQLKKAHLEEYLKEEKLDFDVVIEYLKTNQILQSDK